MTTPLLTIEPIHAFSDNYIWLITCGSNKDCFVVDPGDASVVIETLDKKNLNLTGILITHHHADHTGGIRVLAEHFFSVDVYGPDNPAIQGITHSLDEGETVSVFGHSFTVLSVPGHTLDHIAYFNNSSQSILFCGDTLFSAGCGRLFEGSPEQMQHSLNKFKTLPDQTKVYCAHEYTASNLAFSCAVEPENNAIKDYYSHVKELRKQSIATIPTTIGLEMQINPFLRTGFESVQTAAKNRLNDKKTVENLKNYEVLRVIREWKDKF